jgi:hypothetical protein
MERWIEGQWMLQTCRGMMNREGREGKGREKEGSNLSFFLSSFLNVFFSLGMCIVYISTTTRVFTALFCIDRAQRRAELIQNDGIRGQWREGLEIPCSIFGEIPGSIPREIPGSILVEIPGSILVEILGSILAEILGGEILGSIPCEIRSGRTYELSKLDRVRIK